MSLTCSANPSLEKRERRKGQLGTVGVWGKLKFARHHRAPAPPLHQKSKEISRRLGGQALTPAHEACRGNLETRKKHNNPAQRLKGRKKLRSGAYGQRKKWPSQREYECQRGGLGKGAGFLFVNRREGCCTLQRNHCSKEEKGGKTHPARLDGGWQRN